MWNTMNADEVAAAHRAALLHDAQVHRDRPGRRGMGWRSRLVFGRIAWSPRIWTHTVDLRSTCPQPRVSPW